MVDDAGVFVDAVGVRGEGFGGAWRGLWVMVVTGGDGGLGEDEDVSAAIEGVGAGLGEVGLVDGFDDRCSGCKVQPEFRVVGGVGCGEVECFAEVGQRDEEPRVGGERVEDVGNEEALAPVATQRIRCRPAWVGVKPAE